MADSRQHGAAHPRQRHLRPAATHPMSAIEFVQACRLRGDERVLEVGCGPGYATRALRDALTRGGRIVALEACEATRTEAERRLASSHHATHPATEIRAYDRKTLPLDAHEIGTFDAVLVRHELQHAREPAALLAACLAATKAGGRLLLVDDALSTLRLTPAIDGLDVVWDGYPSQFVEARRRIAPYFSMTP